MAERKVLWRLQNRAKTAQSLRLYCIGTGERLEFFAECRQIKKMPGESKRHIGFFGCVALQIGNIIGTGIYSAPTSIIDSTGSVG